MTTEDIGLLGRILAGWAKAKISDPYANQRIPVQPPVSDFVFEEAGRLGVTIERPEGRCCFVLVSPEN